MRYKKKIKTFVVVLIAALMLACVCCATACGSSDEKEPGTLQSIEVTTIPTTTTYFVGQTFSPHGMVVTAYYDNGESREVTDYTWSPVEKLTVDDSVITITYTENGVTVSTEQEIKVRRGDATVVGIEILDPPDKTEYIAGEPFDPNGMKVLTVLDDGSRGDDVTDSVTYSPSGSLTAGMTEITVSYKTGDQVFTATQSITVEKGSVLVPFGGGTYRGMHQIIIDPDLVGLEGEGYTLSDGVSTGKWTADGVYADSPFGRVQILSASQSVTFEADLSSLSDTSKVGFSANMISARAKTLVEVSSDNIEFTPVGYAASTDSVNGSAYNSDYFEKATSLRGMSVNDGNLYCYYWNIGEYVGESKKVYVRFGWTDDHPNGLQGQTIGADIIDGVCFYDELNLRSVERIEITKQPVKTEYDEGEAFDKTGMEVTAYYDDDSSAVVTSYTVSPVIIGSGTDKVIVTYSYNGKTVTTEVAVKVNESTIEEEVTFGGGTYRGKHVIVLGADDTSYEVNGGAAGKQITDWSGLKGAKRFQTTAADQSVTFTIDLSSLEDRSSAGCMLYLIRSRMRTLIEVSGDGTEWTELGHTIVAPGTSNTAMVISDYGEQATELFGSAVNDGNLFAYYYDLGEYAESDTDGVLYIRCGFTDRYSEIGDTGIGADIIGGMAYFDELRLTTD